MRKKVNYESVGFTKVQSLGMDNFWLVCLKNVDKIFRNTYHEWWEPNLSKDSEANALVLGGKKWEE